MVVGGAAGSWISWRAGFFINVPVGVAMVFLAPRYLPTTPPSGGRFTSAARSAPLSASVRWCLASFSPRGRGGPTPFVAGSLLTGVVVLGGLFVHERRVDQPILPLRIFADRRRSGAYAARGLYLGAMMGFFFFTTQLLQGVLGFTAFQAGLGFLPMTAVNFGVATVLPPLARRFGEAPVLAVGVGLTLVGMVWLAQVDSGSSYVTAVALPMVLIGAGQGLAFAPLTSFGVSGVRPEDAGAASGLVNTAQQLGMATGLAILVAGSAHLLGLVDRIRIALTWGTGLLALCLLVVLTLILPARRAPERGRIARARLVLGAWSQKT